MFALLLVAKHNKLLKRSGRSPKILEMFHYNNSNRARTRWSTPHWNHCSMDKV